MELRGLAYKLLDNPVINWLASRLLVSPSREFYDFTAELGKELAVLLRRQNVNISPHGVVLHILLYIGLCHAVKYVLTYYLITNSPTALLTRCTG